MLKEISLILFLSTFIDLEEKSGSELFVNLSPKDLSIPYQENLSGGDIVFYNGADVKKLAKFEIKARVLSKKRYYSDASSKYSKYDLAMGWGPFYNPENSKHMSISQGGRWFNWRSKELLFPYQVYRENMANIHIIPASSGVEDEISDISEMDGVILKGYLVEVEGSDGFNWRSSMTRSDTGDGACEVFYVESVDIID